MKFSFRSLSRVAVLSSLLGVALSANAAPTVFQGSDNGGPLCVSSGGTNCTVPASSSDVATARSDWLAGTATHQLSNIQTESFGVAQDTTGPFSIFGSSGSELSGADSFLDNDVTGSPQKSSASGFAGRWNTSGDTGGAWVEFTGYPKHPSYTEDCAFLPPPDNPNCLDRLQSDLVIQLADMVDAVAFYLTDFGDVVSAGATIEVFLGSNTTPGSGTMINPADTAEVTFFGLYGDSAFDRVTLRITQSSNIALDQLDQIGLDDLTVANLVRRTSTVPEPQGLAMFALALFAARRFTRRR